MNDGRDVKNESSREKVESAAVKRLDWVAVFSGLLVVVGFLQTWTYMVSDRAYLSVVGVSFDPPKVGEPMVIHLNVKNTGRATAFVSHANVTTLIHRARGPLPMVPQYKDKETFPSIIGPLTGNEIFYGTVHLVTDEGKPVLWSADDVTSKVNIYIYGSIQYDDGFNLFHLWRPRVFGFCWRYDPTSDPSIGMFSTCDQSGYRYGN